MSINLIKILNRLLPTPPTDSGAMADERVSTDKISESTSKKNHAKPFVSQGKAFSKPENLPRLSSQALISVFRKAECCTLDGLNEYDDDFTTFTPLGDLVTHEMQQAADRMVKQALKSANQESLEIEINDAVMAQTRVDESQV